jgi:cellulose synthase/poly-beta-1,6-N-acetylglucosamine synthase-like glycosyltransferase
VLSIAIVLAVAISVVVVHPFVTYPLSLLLLPRIRKYKAVAGGSPAAIAPSIAICMSAFNEERVIAAKIESLLAMAGDYPGQVSIHVYVDGPEDDTARLLLPYVDRADIVFSTDRRGKTWGMGHLVSRSHSDLLLFTDANVISGANALTGLAAPFIDPAVGLASARLRYNNPEESVTSRSGAVYWELEERIKQIEGETIGLVGVDGAMFMIRRSLYRAPPAQLIDDLYVSLSVLIEGSRIISVDSVMVCERSAALASEEFTRKKRIACQAWNVHRALWPQLRRMPWPRLYGYLSHRVLKWLTPLVAIVAAASYFAVLVGLIGGLHATLVVVAGCGLLALGYVMGFAPATLALSMLYSLAGVGIGLLESIFKGRTYTVWEPAESVRSETTRRQNQAISKPEHF